MGNWNCRARCRQGTAAHTGHYKQCTVLCILSAVRHWPWGDDDISNDVRSLLKDAKYCYFQSIIFLFHLKKKCPFLKQLPSFPWSLWRLKSPPGYLLLPGKQIPSLGFLWKHTPLWVPSCDTASSWATWRIPLMKQKKTVTFSGICSLTWKIWISSEQYMQEGQSLWDFQLH